MINALKVAAALVSALACVTGGGLAIAQEPGETPARGALEVKTVVQKVIEQVDEAGELTTELVGVDTAVPGDEIIYTVTFTNIGEEPADNILITNPIPPQMRYVSGTAFGPGSEIEYSADGGTTWAQAAALRVSTATGDERMAEPGDYTHIRWALNTPLDVGERSFARFRAVVR